MISPKLVTSLFVILLLSACVAAMNHVKYDAQKNPVKKIALVTISGPVKMSFLDRKSNIGNQFGLFGVLATDAEHQTSSDLFTLLMQKQGLDFLQVFYQELTASLQSSGFQVEPVSIKKESAFRMINEDDIPSSVTADAVLDVSFASIGIVSATHLLSTSVFKPTISFGVKLVSPKTKQIIYREIVNYGTWNVYVDPTINPDPKYAWDTPEDVVKDPEKAKQSLIDGIKLVTQFVNQQIRQAN